MNCRIEAKMFLKALPGLLFFWYMLTPLPSPAQTEEVPPMVALRLFQPESLSSSPAATAQNTQIEQQWVLTGVVATSHEKKALLSPKVGAQIKGDSSQRSWLCEGESLGDMIVEKIEPNSVILAKGDQKFHLPLYGPGKERPQPAIGALERGAGKAVAGSQKTRQRDEKEAKASGAILSGSTSDGHSALEQEKKDGMQSEASALKEGVAEAPTNPFQKALERVKQQQAGGVTPRAAP